MAKSTDPNTTPHPARQRHSRWVSLHMRPDTTDDNTQAAPRRCTRCRTVIPDNEQPLMLWPETDSPTMLTYCEICARTVFMGA